MLVFLFCGVSLGLSSVTLVTVFALNVQIPISRSESCNGLLQLQTIRFFPRLPQYPHSPPTGTPSPCRCFQAPCLQHKSSVLILHWPVVQAKRDCSLFSYIESLNSCPARPIEALLPTLYRSQLFTPHGYLAASGESGRIFPYMGTPESLTTFILEHPSYSPLHLND